MNKWLSGILFFFALGLLSGHALWPDAVTLDGWMMALFAIAAIMILAPILASAEIPGLASFRFRQQVKEGQEVSEEVEREAAVIAAEAPRNAVSRTRSAPIAAAAGDGTPTAGAAAEERAEQPERIPDVQSTLDLVPISDTLRDLVPREPELALAGLRIAIEGGVRTALDVLAPSPPSGPTRLSLGSAIRRLRDASAMTNTQAQLLLLIVDLCQKAVHGQRVSVDDAAQVFDMVDVLNHSFALGYSLRFQPNPHWREQGLVCEHEHCIEHMPLDPARGEGSCPLFGHDCPGGADRVASCDVAA